jgi:hypothetical protein
MRAVVALRMPEGDAAAETTVLLSHCLGVARLSRRM